MRFITRLVLRCALCREEVWQALVARGTTFARSETIVRRARLAGRPLSLVLVFARMTLRARWVGSGRSRGTECGDDVGGFGVVWAARRGQGYDSDLPRRFARSRRLARWAHVTLVCAVAAREAAGWLGPR